MSNYVPVSRKSYERDLEEICDLGVKAHNIISILKFHRDRINLTDEEISLIKNVEEMLDKKAEFLENFIEDKNNYFYGDDGEFEEVDRG